MAARAWRVVIWVLVALLAAPLIIILLVRFIQPPVTPIMLLRLGQGYELHQVWAPYHRIAPALVQAVIASEDNLFCEQTFGFDFEALTGQVAAMFRDERPRGASTITMQTAKNLLLWPGRDPVRKVIEAWLTPQVALLWPKQRVLEVYLNIVEFGPGVYGAEAAAQRFFGRSAANLTREQALQLALVLPNPLQRSAARPSPAVREHARAVGRRIGQLGPLLDCVR